jgi:hypothetical protein
MAAPMTDAGFALSRRRALTVAAAGAVVSAIGAVVAPEQLLRSYLVAYVFWTGLALGSLALLSIHQVTGGQWGIAIRRLLESAGLTVPVLAVLFVPIALGVRVLYPWAQPEHVAHDPLLQEKALYLNVPFFLVRAAGYFVVWTLLARSMAYWSLAQDASDDPLPARRLHHLSRGCLLLLGLTMTFAAVDWMMSLEPHWASTIYGVIFMGGSVLTSFAFAIPTLALLRDRPTVAPVATPEVFHDLGKLMLAFIMLWAYFALSQFLITWSANLPEEIPWYLARNHGGWQWVALGIVTFHFALPFVVLLSRDVKRRASTLARVAIGLAVMRYVDLYWLVAPAFHPGQVSVHWLDLATVALVGGLWVAAFVRHLAARPLVPQHDPLAEAA